MASSRFVELRNFNVNFSNYRIANGYERAMEMDDEGDADSQNAASDIDSQVSVIHYCNLYFVLSIINKFLDVSASFLHAATRV